MNDIENKNYPNIAQGFAILGIMILIPVLMVPLLMFLNKFFNEDVSQLIYYVLSFGLSFWIVYTIRKRRTNNGTFNFKIENQRIIPFIITAIIALNMGLIAPIISLIPMPEFVKEIFAGLLGEYSVCKFLTIVVAAPVLEELICRGIILDGLLKKYSPIKSILISSVIFGLAHMNPWQFIGAFSLGVFIGWIYYNTKSLSFAIIIHAANNLGAFLISYFSDSDASSMDETLLESYGGILNFISVLIGAIVILVISIYFLRREFRKEKIFDSPPILQVRRQTKRVFVFIAIVLLSIMIFISNDRDHDNDIHLSMSLEDCFKKNIEDSTLMTGWYYLSEIEDGFVRQMDKTDDFHNINPYPIVIAEDIITLNIETNNIGDSYLAMRFGKRGTESWREATSNAIGKKLAFIVDDKLLSVSLVNAEITNGNSALYSTDYTKEDLEIIEQAIKVIKK